VGVNVAPNEIAPEAAGVHEHVARNGVAVAVATEAQPVMVVPPALKFTVPATLAVAVMVAGPIPKIAFGSVRVMVVGVAADALETPMTAMLPRDITPAATSDMNLFILESSPVVGY
jgi:hypothetical protein